MELSDLKNNSLSSWEYLHSAGARDLEAKAIGFSSLFRFICDKTAPTPYGEASQDIGFGFCN